MSGFISLLSSSLIQGPQGLEGGRDLVPSLSQELLQNTLPALCVSPSHEVSVLVFYALVYLLEVLDDGAGEVVDKLT